ncbi:hypothetical protein ACHAXR_010810 [Thalassiosira sp. AJA248-18]
MATSKHPGDDAPPTKRSKTEGNGGHDGEEPHANIRLAWGHYRNFIDGDAADEERECTSGGNEDDDEGSLDHQSGGGEADGGGDIDELLELIEILSSGNDEAVSPLTTDLSSKQDDSGGGNNASPPAPAAEETLFRSIETLLPILLSMSYLHLASYAISETMCNPKHDGDNDNSSSPEYYFGQSLHYWPTNPAAHSLFANYHRMNSLSSLDNICQHYIKAAEHARCWRPLALGFLQSTFEEELKEGINAKEWVELLVLNGALDVDYIGGEGDEEEEEDGADEDGEQEEYSCSEVEATASFMSAFLLSVLSKHEDALPHLQKFQLSHRIHPNVWKEAQSHKRGAISSQTHNGSRKCNGKSTDEPSPRIYHGGSKGGVIPPELYQRFCTLFAPNAPYWNESDYNNRGYYSYFIDLDSTESSASSVRHCPTNVIEEVIVNYLLPLAERSLQENDTESSAPKIVGAEWWAHTRPLGANLGHQIHFDTDESLLGREKRVTHPIISSVMYLTGAKDSTSAGSTIVFDQTPDSTDVASKAWISHPRNNAFMTFPGNLLHGVLPCASGTGNEEGVGTSGSSDNNEENHRLTFMVGFWTRDVTKGMGERQLYSPCGPLPPATSDHSWVIESQRGYNDSKQQNYKNGGNAAKNHQSDLTFDILPSASPAWEQFQSATLGSTLTIPKGLDHRFFVLNAPHCFSDSLFEKEDCF